MSPSFGVAGGVVLALVSALIVVRLIRPPQRASIREAIVFDSQVEHELRAQCASYETNQSE